MSAIIKEERIGGQRLILGDCLDVMKELGQFDAVVTDVPYGISQVSGGLRRLDYGEWDKETATPVALEALTICLKTPTIIAWCDWRQLPAIESVLPGRSVRPMVWRKSNPPVLNGQHLPLSSCEFAFYGKLAGAYFGGKCHHGAWIGTSPRERRHPTQKPEWLMMDCVKLASSTGRSVLDPFMGSGTTLVACQRMGRNGTGIELDPEYFQIACERVDEATRQGDMFVPTVKPKPIENHDIFEGDAA